MKFSSTTGSSKYRYDPYADRFLDDGSGIFLIIFARILRFAGVLIDLFGLIH